MTIAKTLSRTETLALLERFGHAWPFVLDLTSLPTIMNLETHTISGCKVFSFLYGNSMGSGGGLLYGNSGWYVFVGELSSCQNTDLQLHPLSLWQRLRCLVFKNARVVNIGGIKRTLKSKDFPNALRFVELDSVHSLLSQEIETSLCLSKNILLAAKPNGSGIWIDANLAMIRFASILKIAGSANGQ